MEGGRVARNGRWLVAAGGILLAVYGLTLVMPVLSRVFSFLLTLATPFVLAFIIAYLLHPLVRRFTRRRVPRPVAVILAYTLFLAVATVAVLRVAPEVVVQMRELARQLPQWATAYQQWLDWFHLQVYQLPDGIRQGISASIAHMETRTQRWMMSWLNGLDDRFKQAMILFVAPFIAYYILRDYGRLKKTVLEVVPRHHRRRVLRVLRDIDRTLGSYIRGQLLVCLVVGVLAYIGYRLIDLPYPLFLAVMVGITNIIPYFGPILGMIPALLVAVTVSGKMALMVVAVNFVIQFIEGNIASPLIVGRTLHLHPLWIIFALLAGGELGGIVGMIFAVPVFAVLKVLVQHAVMYAAVRR